MITKQTLSSILILLWILISAAIGCKFFYGVGKIPLIYEKKTVHSFNNIFAKEFSKELFQKNIPYLQKTADDCIKKFSLSGIVIKDAENNILLTQFNPELQNLTHPDAKPVSKKLFLQKIIDTPELISIENGNLYRIKARSLLFSSHIETMTIELDENYAGSVYLFHSGGIVTTGITAKDLKPWFSIWLIISFILSCLSLILLKKTSVKDEKGTDANETIKSKIDKVYYLPDPSYRFHTNHHDLSNLKSTQETKNENEQLFSKKPDNTVSQPTESKISETIGDKKEPSPKKQQKPKLKPVSPTNLAKQKPSKKTADKQKKNEIIDQPIKKETDNSSNRQVNFKQVNEPQKPQVARVVSIKKNTVVRDDPDDWFLLGPYKLNRATLSENDIFQQFQGKHLNADSSETFFSIKRLKPKFYAHTLVYNAFIQSAYMARQLLHPSIARIIEIREKDYAVVTEYVKGKNLSQLLLCSYSGIPVQFALHIISEVCSALDCAFTYKTPGTGEPLRIIHKNLNLQNILISGDGQVKVSDFGMYHACKSIIDDDKSIPHPSISYMAPELLKDNITDAKTDIFALGSIFYEIISGKRLTFVSDNPEKLVTIPGIDSILIEPLLQCIEKAVHYDRSQRYSSAVAMYNEIQKLLEIVPEKYNQTSFESFISGLS